MYRLILSVLMLVSTAGAWGQNTPKLYGDWTVLCENDVCRAEQHLAAPSNPRIRYSSEVKFVRESGNPVMKLSFPLGVYLARGIGFKAGDQQRDVPFSVCLPVGCHAVVVLTEELLSAMRDQDSYSIRLYVTSAKPAEINYSLDGFAEALEQIR